MAEVTQVYYLQSVPSQSGAHNIISTRLGLRWPALTNTLAYCVVSISTTVLQVLGSVSYFRPSLILAINSGIRPCKPQRSQYTQQRANMHCQALEHFTSSKVRLSQVRLGQVRLGQVRLGQVRLGQVRLGQVAKSLIILNEYFKNFCENLLLLLCFKVMQVFYLTSAVFYGYTMISMCGAHYEVSL